MTNWSSRRNIIMHKTGNKKGGFIGITIPKYPTVMEKPKDFQKALLLWNFFYTYVFETWKIIRTNETKSKKGIFEIMKRKGIKINVPDDILKKIPIVKNKETFYLVLVSLADLGFNNDQHQINGTKYEEICLRIKQLGLKLCPLELIPYLRMQYLNQPKGGIVAIGTEPITDDYNYLTLLLLGHNDSGIWLTHYNYGVTDDFWYKIKFAFVLQRPPNETQYIDKDLLKSLFLYINWRFLLL